MLLVVVVLASALCVPLTGGRLALLAELPLRRPELIGGAVALQVVVLALAPRLPYTLGVAGHLLSYALAGAFAAVNLRVPGLWVVALGGLANLAAIAANGGVMPASAQALALAGLPVHPAGAELVNSDLVAGARLAFLGDVMAVPAGWPLANVFSAGDVLIAAGAAWLVHRACRPGALGGRDSNPRYRDQNPASYQLDDPPPESRPA